MQYELAAKGTSLTNRTPWSKNFPLGNRGLDEGTKITSSESNPYQIPLKNQLRDMLDVQAQ